MPHNSLGHLSDVLQDGGESTLVGAGLRHGGGARGRAAGATR